MSHRFVALGLTLLLVSCKTHPTRVVAEGAECTSPYDDAPVTLTCGPGDRCLLMQSTPPGPSGLRRYLCLRSCKEDADCSALGASFRCEHVDGHGDEHGCTPR